MPYINKNNVLVSKMVIKRSFNFNAQVSMWKSFPQLVLVNFFISFWKLADFSKQNIFLHGRPTVQSVKPVRSQPRKGTGSAKTKIFQYFILDVN